MVEFRFAGTVHSERFEVFMPIINRVAALTDEITAWRRDLTSTPSSSTTCIARRASWPRS